MSIVYSIGIFYSVQHPNQETTNTFQRVKTNYFETFPIPELESQTCPFEPTSMKSLNHRRFYWNLPHQVPLVEAADECRTRGMELARLGTVDAWEDVIHAMGTECLCHVY